MNLGVIIILGHHKADLHSFTTIRDAKQLKENTYATAAAWLAFGFDALMIYNIMIVDWAQGKFLAHFARS